MSDILDEQEFYELMQTYRQAPFERQSEVVDSFEAVKDFIREHKEDISNEFLTATIE